MIYLGIGVGVVAVVSVLAWLGIKAVTLAFDLSGIDFSDDDNCEKVDENR